MGFFIRGIFIVGFLFSSLTARSSWSEMEQPPQSRSEKLEELNLTEEKARMILEAMKNSEVQYIQQNQKKATQRPDSNKPDW